MLMIKNQSLAETIDSSLIMQVTVLLGRIDDYLNNVTLAPVLSLSSKNSCDSSRAR